MSAGEIITPLKKREKNKLLHQDSHTLPRWHQVTRHHAAPHLFTLSPGTPQPTHHTTSSRGRKHANYSHATSRHTRLSSVTSHGITGVFSDLETRHNVHGAMLQKIPHVMAYPYQIACMFLFSQARKNGNKTTLILIKIWKKHDFNKATHIHTRESLYST